MIEYMKEKEDHAWKLHFSVRVQDYRLKRETQSIALNLEPYSNSVWLFDVGEERNTKSYIIQ